MKILMYSNYSMNNKGVFDLSIKNHYDYCSKYNIDMIQTMSSYTPFNNVDEIRKLFSLYDTIITIGTDILITNFNKNIMNFNDTSKGMVIQDEGTGTSVNGDFIFWNKIIDYEKFLNDFNNFNSATTSSQQAINDIINSDSNLKNYIKILPKRTLQSICPFGNENNNNVKNKDVIWIKGDFSVHMHKPGSAPNVKNKIKMMGQFIEKYEDLLF